MNKQKGATLYFTIVIMSILLAAVFSIGSLLLVQLKSIKQIGDSVVAYYAADSGAEIALFNAKTGHAPGSGPNGTLGAARYETIFFATGTPDCVDGKYYCILSIGDYQGVERRVKITR